MAPRLAAAMLAGMMFLAAAVVARQRETPATPQVILSAVVEIGPSSVRILSATAVRGVIRPTNQQALIDVPRGTGQVLIEYTATSKSLPAGTAPFTSAFHVSFTPIVEEPPVPIPAGPAFKPGRPVVVAIALPDLPADTMISFARLTPADSTPPDQWSRATIGQAPLPPVRR